MDYGVRVFWQQFAFVVDNIVICISGMSSCDACYLIWTMQVVKVHGGDDWSLCDARVYLILGLVMDLQVWISASLFSPGCAYECFVYFYVFLWFYLDEFGVEGKAEYFRKGIGGKDIIIYMQPEEI